MHTFRRILFLTLTTVVAATACDSSEAGVLDPEIPLVGAESPRGDWVFRINGGGVGMEQVTSQLNNVHVNAWLYEDGSVDGSVFINIRTPKGQDDLGTELSAFGRWDASCMEVDGNMAWISGPLVRGRRVSGLPSLPLGTEFLAIIQRNGPGDYVGYFAPAFFVGAADCTDRPPFPPGGDDYTLHGNFTFHERG